jgi:N-methylhydantoinase A
LRIAVTAMSYAVKAVTTERGLDAGDFALIAYGGAGPLHAVEIAREIGITRVIIPAAPGVFSAFGMLFSDLRYDFVRTWPMRLEDTDFDVVERIYGELEDDGRRAVAETSIAPRKVTAKRAADMRYVGQEHAVTVDLPMSVFSRQNRAAIKRHFDEMHAVRYGTSAPEEPAEIVSLRTTVTGVVDKPAMRKIARGAATPSRAASAGTRPVFHRDRGFVPTRTFARGALVAGNRIKGPALIEEHASTTVLTPGDTATVDAWGNLVIAVGKGR